MAGVTAVGIQATHAYLVADSAVNQLVFDDIDTPQAILNGQATYESTSTDAVLSVLPFPTGYALIVRVQLTAETDAPNYNFATYCQGAIMEGNGQRTVTFSLGSGDDTTLGAGVLPLSELGATTQATILFPKMADQTKPCIGGRLTVCPQAPAATVTRVA